METHDEILNSYFTSVTQNKSSTTDLQVARGELGQKPGRKVYMLHRSSVQRAAMPKVATVAKKKMISVKLGRRIKKDVKFICPERRMVKNCDSLRGIKPVIPQIIGRMPYHRATGNSWQNRRHTDL